MALLALSDGEVAGCASYDVLRDQEGQAEVAFAVADHMHHRGIATLLLEHLVSVARSQGVTVFTAETLTENTAMLKVFSDAGLPVHRHSADGVVELTIPLPGDAAGTALDSYLNAVAERERRADIASLRHVLAPESVVVIGASRRQGHGGPGDPGQHPHRRVRRAGLRGQPARPADRRRALPVLRARPARAGRPGGDRGPGRGSAGRGASSAGSAACGPWW